MKSDKMSKLGPEMGQFVGNNSSFLANVTFVNMCSLLVLPNSRLQSGSKFGGLPFSSSSSFSLDDDDVDADRQKTRAKNA